MRPHPNTTTRPDASRTLLSRLQRFGVHDGGATAVIAAIMFPVVIGGLGLGAEAGYWYLTERKLQHIADVSAHAAGARLRADDTDEQIVAAARHVASQSGYRGTPELAVNPNYGEPEDMMVEVVATDVQPRLFSAVVANFFSDEPQTTVRMSARAVSQVVAEPGSVACVLALAPNAPRAVTMDGSSTIGLEGCDIASNSNAADSLYATSSITTGCAYAVGRAVTTAGLTLANCEQVKENAPIVRDPYKDVPEPTSWSNCSKSGQGHPTRSSTPLTPTCFSGGLVVKGELHFEPGLYIIDGGEFTVNAGDNSKLTGEGVTLYLANGARLNIGGSIQMNMSAPSDPANPYAGILFFGDRNATGTNHVVAGNSNSDYTGALYTPASQMSFTGNSKSGGGGCTQIIGARVTFTGNSSLKSTCESAGTSDIVTNELVKLVE